MVTERELLDAIRECESAPSSFRSCERLAVFYSLYDRLYEIGRASCRERV